MQQVYKVFNNIETLEEMTDILKVSAQVRPSDAVEPKDQDDDF
jgi:hypothetical protein